MAHDSEFCEIAFDRAARSTFRKDFIKLNCLSNRKKSEKE